MITEEMTRCAVPRCNEVGNHVFPKDIKIRKLWQKAIRRPKFVPTKYSRLCREHFIESDYEHHSRFTGVEHQHKYLKKIAVPSVFSWNKKDPTKLAEERSIRLLTRKNLYLFQPSVSSQSEDIVRIIIDEDISHELEINTVKTELDRSAEVAETLPNTFGTLTPNMLRLFSSEMLLADDEMVNYYTGLESVSKFNFVFRTLLPMAYNMKCLGSKVSMKDHFIMLLMKLRLNQPDCELGNMFGVSKTEVSKIVVTWIIFVNNFWGLIDIWPSINIPTFLKAKSQIPGVLLKEEETYKILTSELNQCYVPFASKIFFICMMLCNFRECVMLC